MMMIIIIIMVMMMIDDDDPYGINKNSNNNSIISIKLPLMYVPSLSPLTIYGHMEYVNCLIMNFKYQPKAYHRSFPLF